MDCLVNGMMNVEHISLLNNVRSHFIVLGTKDVISVKWVFVVAICCVIVGLTRVVDTRFS